MITKEILKNTIDNLPEIFDVEEIIEKLIVLDKIDQGLKDIEESNVYTTKEVKQSLDKWLQ